MIIDFDWFSYEGVQNTINMVYKVLEVLRIIVPIGLIIMTTLDVTKKVINPEDKEGQKKIMIRLIAALIVFLVPTIIKFFLKIADIQIPNINTDPTPTAKPTDKPKPPVNVVECQEGKYLPANSNQCQKCLANYYCPGGSFTIYTNTSSGLKYCGDNYTSPIGSTSISDCVKKIVPTIKPTIKPTNSPKPTNTPTPTVAPTNTPTPTINSLIINNCPSNKVFRNGDVIRLNTNVPNDYHEEVIWGWGLSNGDLTIINETNSEYAFAITNVTSHTSFSVIATLDSLGYQDSCKITIEP